MKLLQKIRALKQRLDVERAIVELGNDAFVLKWDRWPILGPRRQCSVRWDDVRRIEVCMWDCFTLHSVGLLFDDGHKRCTRVSESRKGYSEFVTHVMERFPEFNRHNFKEIEKCFPSDICFPCWDRAKPVDDLEARPAEMIVVWKKDGRVFSGGADNG